MTHDLSTMKYFNGLPEIEEPQRKCATQWERGIWIACVLCCVVGCYELVHGAKMAYQHVTGSAAASSRPDRKRTREEIQFDKANKKFLAKNQSLMVSHRVFEMAAGLALVIGGALMMWRSPLARRFVIAACIAAITFHLSTAMLKVYQFVSLKEIYESVGSLALRKSGVGGQYHKSILQQMLGSMGFGHSLGVLFVLALQGLFYGRLFYFMAQPHVREAFAEDPYPEFRELEAEVLAEDAAAFADSVRKQLEAEDKRPEKESNKKERPAATKFAKV